MKTTANGSKQHRGRDRLYSKRLEVILKGLSFGASMLAADVQEIAIAGPSHNHIRKAPPALWLQEADRTVSWQKGGLVRTPIRTAD